MTEYRIESWNPTTNKYEWTWEGPKEYAITMINKSYNSNRTRRLIKITTQVIVKVKKGEFTRNKI